MSSDYQPKCHSCVDSYRDQCHCQKSVFFGMDLDNIPWDGCSCFLSERKWGYVEPKTRRRKKYPSLEEFEFGV